MIHTAMQFSQTINPLPLIAVLLLRKVHCILRGKADSLNSFDTPKFIKTLEYRLNFPLELECCKHSTMLNKGQSDSHILFPLSSLQANGRQSQSHLSNYSSRFGLTLCSISQDTILFFLISNSILRMGEKILTMFAKYVRMTKQLKTALSVHSNNWFFDLQKQVSSKYVYS